MGFDFQGSGFWGVAGLNLEHLNLYRDQYPKPGIMVLKDNERFSTSTVGVGLILDSKRKPVS